MDEKLHLKAFLLQLKFRLQSDGEILIFVNILLVYHSQNLDVLNRQINSFICLN